VSMNKLKAVDMTDILIKIYTFLQYYNNNYRPIYHFENFIVYLTMKVHGCWNHFLYIKNNLFR
jgi:hypothetical protein